MQVFLFATRTWTVHWPISKYQRRPSAALCAQATWKALRSFAKRSAESVVAGHQSITSPKIIRVHHDSFMETVLNVPNPQRLLQRSIPLGVSFYEPTVGYIPGEESTT